MLLKLIRRTEQYAESTLQYNYATQHRVRKKNHKNESIHNNKQHQITAMASIMFDFDSEPQPYLPQASPSMTHCHALQDYSDRLRTLGTVVLIVVSQPSSKIIASKKCKKAMASKIH